MRYKAQVKKLNPHIEEEVTLEIQGHVITAFSSICPYVLEEGKSYPISIGFTILDKFEIRELNEDVKSLEQVDIGYQYYIKGILHEDFIDAGLIILDEDEYFVDYTYLIGKYVEIKVDRLDIEFI
ncbi:hypothetical protein [Hazenella coriacea]|uniref:Uncharacterized protein n=1 Tax=Hazenella coriacea TaxID=1179467 RepID=A0A4R3L925_9BACL|nr:hypothetical protein [Hazenella coriacea]TCS96551.1 hypothetical protein EDD58_101185 [Hazenella coriacea]